MRPGTARALHACTACLVASGCALLWMVFFFDPDLTGDAEAFAIGHPWQPLTTDIHILTGPALVFLVGLVWGSHVWTRIRTGYPKRRRTGLLLAALFPLLALSGYALQITADEDLRLILGWLHAGLGIAFGGVYGWHQFLPRTPQAPATDGNR